MDYFQLKLLNDFLLLLLYNFRQKIFDIFKAKMVFVVFQILVVVPLYILFALIRSNNIYRGN